MDNLRFGRGISHGRHSLRNLLAIKSWPDFHEYLIHDALERLFAKEFAGTKPRSILAICADWKEAAALQKFPFETITLTGLLPADEQMQEYVQRDRRITYEQQNAECLRFPSRSFDIVFCKEGLHHLARPVMGLYEMLRTSRQAVVFIEGYDGWLSRRLEQFGISSDYETDQHGNIGQRRNYVFRWSPRHLQGMMNSYYLDSGWRIELVTGWMGNRVHLGRRRWLGNFNILAGWVLNFLPGLEGNTLTTTIYPGTDLPNDPQAIRA
jgi:SAM-dependent methyltransferase